LSKKATTKICFIAFDSEGAYRMRRKCSGLISI
jgi:hypothetical protein